MKVSPLAVTSEPPRMGAASSNQNGQGARVGVVAFKPLRNVASGEMRVGGNLRTIETSGCRSDDSASRASTRARQKTSPHALIFAGRFTGREAPRRWVSGIAVAPVLVTP